MFCILSGFVVVSHKYVLWRWQSGALLDCVCMYQSTVLSLPLLTSIFPSLSLFSKIGGVNKRPYTLQV